MHTHVETKSSLHNTALVCLIYLLILYDRAWQNDSYYIRHNSKLSLSLFFMFVCVNCTDNERTCHPHPSIFLFNTFYVYLFGNCFTLVAMNAKCYPVKLHHQSSLPTDEYNKCPHAICFRLQFFDKSFEFILQNVSHKYSHIANINHRKILCVAQERKLL